MVTVTKNDNDSYLSYSSLSIGVRTWFDSAFIPVRKHFIITLSRLSKARSSKKYSTAFSTELLESANMTGENC